MISFQFGNKVLYSSNNKSKVHECLTCGTEFSSGQTLRGHMRHHKTFMSTTTTYIMSARTNWPFESHEAKKQISVLQSDLNLPIPTDDHKESQFSLVSKE